MESVPVARLWRPKSSPLRRLGAIAKGRLVRRHSLIALATAALLAGGYLLFRDSPFVAVERVEIVGVSGPNAAAISQSLDRIAKGMSTLHYSESALIASVARYRVVKALSVTTSFPHTMRIAVSEQLPVAALSANGVRTAVAADGVVLGPTLLKRSLPSVPVAVAPAVGRRIGDARLRSYLVVLGDAPAPLLPLISRVFDGKQGLTVQMRDGLLVYFGDARRPHAKWDSMVSVLSLPDSAGASYVDVRLPERPAVGGPSGGVGGGGVGSGEAGQVSASDPTSAALAASLAKAVNGEPVTPAAPSSGTAAGTSEGAAAASRGPAASPSSEEPQGSAGAGSGTQGEAPAGGSEGEGSG